MATAATYTLRAADVKVADPTSVVMIVNRDSNDIAFMDIKTKKIVGKAFLGNNVNPHMVMMSPDGRYVVTGGTRANKAYIIDAQDAAAGEGDPGRHRAGAPGVLAGQPLVLPGQSRRRFDLGDRHGVADEDQDDSRASSSRSTSTFLPDGSKAYVGNYGAHWVGVIDVRRHELLKKIQVADVPGVAKLDPEKYLGEIKGINIAALTNDGRFLYAADGDLGVVGVIDPREDKVIKVIRVGKDPWRIYMSHDGKYAITPNNGDETISIIDLQANKVAATLEAGPEHDRRQLRRRQGVRHQLDQRLRLRLRHEDAAAGRPDQDRHEHPARDGDDRHRRTRSSISPTRPRTRSSSSTRRPAAFEKVMNVGLFPWGTHIMDSKDNYCH